MFWETVWLLVFVAACGGLAIGRWWIVPPSMVGWIVYIRVIYPANHQTSVRLEPGLQAIAETTADVFTWIAAGMIGGACMIGVVFRRALVESLRRRSHSPE